MKITIEGTEIEILKLIKILNNVNLKTIEDSNVITCNSKRRILERVKHKLPSVVDLYKFQYIEKDDIGYFGRVNSLDFITYKDLCEKLNFHEGELMKNAGWLVFWYKGSVLFISQHTVRYNLSWDDINKHKLVFGERTINIESNNYSVMLPTGGSEENNGIGTIWNDLIYRVHEEFGVWDKLSDIDLCIDYVWGEIPLGVSSWCQESWYDVHRTFRGHFWLESVHATKSSVKNIRHGARFVLKQDIE